MDMYENEDLNPENESPRYDSETESRQLHQTDGEPAETYAEVRQPYGGEPQTDSGYISRQSYSGVGVGRKESPYADSPYVMNHNRQTGGYQYQTYTPPVTPQEPVRKAPKKKKSVWKPVLASVLTLALVAGGCGITAALVNQHWEDRMERMALEYDARLDGLQQQIEADANASSGVSVSGSPVSAGDSLTPSQVYARNVQSVVLISCEVTSSSYYGPTSGTSTGSGFVLSADGYVVTNHHVIDGATSVTVSTYDGVQYPAKIVGSDSTNDVALLKVEATDLPHVTLGSSDELIVGDQVAAIGNPLGDLTSTMTVGYVSAKDRDVTTDGTTINMLQTDVAINSGNSGGPLFNMKGEVVGITTAKYSGSSASGATIEGIGFAIPMDDVVGLIESLRDYGYITGAYLGVSVRDVETSAQYYGVPAGAYIVEVVPGYCAQVAGIQAGDIIIDLGGYEVESYTDLSRALRKFESGDTTTVTVYRNGQEVILTITLDEKPHEETAADSGTQQPNTGEMPQDGSYEDWYNYFAPFFGNGNG